MSLFEKWLKEDSKKTGFLYDTAAEEQRKKGWRGALEMIHAEFGLSPICSNAIREELNATD